MEMPKPPQPEKQPLPVNSDFKEYSIDIRRDDFSVIDEDENEYA